MFKILKYEELISTNKFALEHISELDANTVIQAEIQTSGRGRFSRKWISDKSENCYISFVLKPDMINKNNFPNLTQYLSIILCDNLVKYGLEPEIKWPNDVLINGKKIAGILSEASFANNNFNGIVLGIGVNLNLSIEDLGKIEIPATSLNIETGKKTDSETFINSLVSSFFKDYELLLKKGFVEFKNKYLLYSDFINKDIQIKNPELQYLGKALGVNDDGSLKILTVEGEEKNIFSGDMIKL